MHSAKLLLSEATNSSEEIMGFALLEDSLKDAVAKKKKKKKCRDLEFPGILVVKDSL